MAMNILASPTTPATPEKGLFMLPRPNAKELPYMIQILKELAKVNCEKDYSDWMISLHRHNKLNLALSEIILLTWMHDINEHNNWQTTVTCNICMDVVRLEHLDRRIQPGEDVEQIGYFVPSCSHAFCTPCLAQYLEMKLKAPVTQFPVKCPHYDCQNNVVDSLAARVLDVDVMELWWDKQTEAGMSNKIYCPHPDCAVPLENDIARTGCDYMTECPVCNRAFCSACVSPWHPGVSCEENMTWTEEQRDMRALLTTADDLAWSCCPSCKSIVEKNQGCNHITCVCRCEFCYRCGNLWESVNYTGCTAKCQSWSKSKLAAERKKNMPSLPGQEMSLKSKLGYDGRNGGQSLEKDIDAARARRALVGRFRGIFRR